MSIDHSQLLVFNLSNDYYNNVELVKYTYPLPQGIMLFQCIQTKIYNNSYRYIPSYFCTYSDCTVAILLSAVTAVFATDRQQYVTVCHLLWVTAASH